MARAGRGDGTEATNANSRARALTGAALVAQAFHDVRIIRQLLTPS